MVTFTGPPIGTGHEAHVAFTAVPARGVEALAVAAEVQVLGALVEVCRQKHRLCFCSQVLSNASGPIIFITAKFLSITVLHHNSCLRNLKSLVFSYECQYQICSSMGYRVGALNAKLSLTLQSEY